MFAYYKFTKNHAYDLTNYYVIIIIIHMNGKTVKNSFIICQLDRERGSSICENFYPIASYSNKNAMIHTNQIETMCLIVRQILPESGSKNFNVTKYRVYKH